jgi:hypothetical protein
MRFGTLVFLGLFGAWFFQHRAACDLGHRLRAECQRALAPRGACDDDEPALEERTSSATSARVRELQGELDRLERRGRDLERSLQAVTQSTRALRELADRHRDDAVRAEYAEIEAGRARLADLRERNEVERVAVAARLQLARAGLPTGPGLRDAGDGRESPVEALSSSAEGEPRRRVSARAR